MGNITKHAVFYVSWISRDIPTHWVEGILLLLCLCVCVCVYICITEQLYRLLIWYNAGDGAVNECGTLMASYWQGHTTSLRGIPVLVPICPTQISHGGTWDWPRASVTTGCWLTIWAMVGPHTLTELWWKAQFFAVQLCPNCCGCFFGWPLRTLFFCEEYVTWHKQACLHVMSVWLLTHFQYWEQQKRQVGNYK
jgi:hypothetical protein